jgi:3-oxoacyl-[acyl-carrier protein] reductase
VDLGIAGKACVVTGATRGIGLATARLLAAEGAGVLLVGRREAVLQAAADALDGDAAPLALDVTDRDAPARVLAACRERLGEPWALVNNAGTSRQAALEELTDEDWREQWELHVMAPQRLMRAFAPAMAEQGSGRIVNVCSSSGKRPSLSNAAYSVTKAAQLSLSRVYADAYAGRNVLVNAVAPGPVETPLWMDDGGLADQAAKRQGVSREEALEAARGKIPLGRFGTEDEMAAVIAFLCSELASDVAGAAWSVDGGSVPTIV